jgi:hypothetical protein
MVSFSVAMVPEGDMIVIQVAFTVEAQVLSLERLLERTTVCGDGSVPPLVAEKVRALGLTCKAHDGFTKPRSIANVTAVSPRIVDIICRIDAVRRSWIVIQVVLSDTKAFLLSSAHRGGAAALLGEL